MIIYGFSSSVKAGGDMAEPCSECSKPTLVSVKAFRYFHLFYLPVLPLGSKKGTNCTHCLKTDWGKEVSAAEKADPAFEESPASRPRWHMIGPALLSMLIAFVFFSGDSDREIRSKQAAAQPTVGDVWIVDISDVIPDLEAELNYAVARVDTVSPDGDVFLGFSDWQYDGWLTAYRKAKDAVEEADPEYFTETGLWFSIEDLVKFEGTGDVTWAASASDVS